ncbi:MAG TPA: RND transporter, partial [Aestuariivirgaceae bacterium]|nr:RND transporter [Aestuariivirgaceae bacterium]
MSGTNFRTISVAVFAASFTAGCSLTPDYFRPEVPVPQTYTAKSATVEPTLDPEWWRLFRNRTLTRLVTEANVDNTDIGAAVARVRQAR